LGVVPPDKHESGAAHELNRAAQQAEARKTRGSACGNAGEQEGKTAPNAEKERQKYAEFWRASRGNDREQEEERATDVPRLNTSP